MTWMTSSAPTRRVRLGAGGGPGARLNSALHFAKRHGLIIIVALGESIVSIGIGVAALLISWPIIVTLLRCRCVFG